jgi:hypothetical protein
VVYVSSFSKAIAPNLRWGTSWPGMSGCKVFCDAASPDLAWPGRSLVQNVGEVDVHTTERCWSDEPWFRR